MTGSPRAATALDALADAHLDAVVALSPLTATFLGVSGRHDEIDDLSIEGLRASRDLAADTSPDWRASSPPTTSTASPPPHCANAWASRSRSWICS